MHFDEPLLFVLLVAMPTVDVVERLPLPLAPLEELVVGMYGRLLLVVTTECSPLILVVFSFLCDFNIGVGNPEGTFN